MFTRTLKDDGARYFGPYTNAAGLRELIDLIRIVFPLRTCREPIDGKRKRPCLQYHIKRCLAPCVGYQSEDDYDRLVDEVTLFLEGHYDPLMERLQREMSDAAEHFNFEAAARLRDRIIAVRRTIEAQKVVWRSRIDVDLMALARAQGQACVQVFLVRDGKLLGPGALHPRGRRRDHRRRAVLGVPQAVLHRAHRQFRHERRARRRDAPARRWRCAPRATSRRRSR